MSGQIWSTRVLPMMLGALLATSASRADSNSWVRRAGGCYTTDPPYEPFMMDTLGSSSGHLVGTASYRDYRPTHLPVTIEGSLAADNRFWPNVTAQVANDMKGEWKTIETPPRQGEAAILTVTLDSPNIMLHLELDVFLPFTGKLQFGRVLLKNGQAAAFRLQDLLPPQTDKEDTRSHNSNEWSREMVFGGPPDPLTAGSPFIVATISGKGNHAEGLCGYFDVKATSSISVDGTETPDGRFWPYIVAQVAHDYRGVWIVLGQSSNQGKPSTLTVQPKDLDAKLHVDLDIFRPMVGKFRYGRVVLKSGVSAAFELKDILP